MAMASVLSVYDDIFPLALITSNSIRKNTTLIVEKERKGRNISAEKICQSSQNLSAGSKKL